MADWLDNLDYAVQQTIADIVGSGSSGSWTDYRNVVGFASALVWHASLLAQDPLPRYTHCPEPATANLLRCLERWAGGKRWDASTELDTELLAIMTTGKITKTRESYLIAGVVGLTDAIRDRKRLREPLQRLAVSALLTGLDDQVLATCVLPWRLRDRQPNTRKARAFEAALDSGNREFAYAMFDKSDLGE